MSCTKVINNLGQIQFENNLKFFDMSQDIRVGNLPQGFYYLSFQLQNTIYSIPFILE